MIGNASAFDLSRRFNVNAYQRLLDRSRLLDGYILSDSTEGQDGGARVTAQEKISKGNFNRNRPPRSDATSINRRKEYERFPDPTAARIGTDRFAQPGDKFANRNSPHFAYLR